MRGGVQAKKIVTRAIVRDVRKAVTGIEIRVPLEAPT
jgi:hypothetical protein